MTDLMPPTIETLKPGLFTTIQDLGRFGFQKFGVSVSGAMDFFSHRVANLLVGNDESAATLECTLRGPTLRFFRDVRIAITGANLSPKLDEQEIPQWQSVEVRKGSVLSFGQCRRGCRAYIAVAGGLDVPLVLGSRSTHARTQLGGFEGRPLKSGDVLSALETEPTCGRRAVHPARRFESPWTGRILSSRTLRFISGPHEDYFVPGSLENFSREKYIVSTHSDRMGIRFEGARLIHRSSADIISDAVPCGAIQVPANGRPIVLAADRQTTGGYPKIAVVITADFPVLAQLKPGDAIQFQPVRLEESLQEFRTLEAAIANGII